MFDRAALKRDVRDMLRGNWGSIFLTLLLWGLLTVAIVFVAGLLSIPTLGLASLAATLLLFNPLTVSLYRYMSRFFRQQRPEMGEAFNGFSNYGKNVGAMFWQYLWLLIWMLPSIGLMIFGAIQMGVGMSFIGALSGNIQDMYSVIDAVSFGMTGMGLLLMLLGYIAMIIPLIKGYSYYLVPYLIGEYPDLNMRECLDLSKKIMHGHKWELFVFQLSFLPWILLASVTCGIAYIYVAPYMYVSEAAYYDHVKNLALDSGVIRPSELMGGTGHTVDYL